METVSHTLFYPLLGRAQAAHTWPDLFPDPWATQAEEIAKREGTPARILKGFPTVVYGVRHQISVVEIKKYLDEHPGAAVVNIGCGLDQLAIDLADYECTIYNLDFPEVLEMRKRWITPADNEKQLPYSATDLEWLNHVQADNGMIAVAAGVIYYLEVESVRRLVLAMSERFPGGRFTYDSESPRMLKFSEKAIAKHGTPTPMPFVVNDPYIAKTWAPVQVRVEFNFLNYVPFRARLPLRVRGAFFGMEITKGMYQVTIDF